MQKLANWQNKTNQSKLVATEPYYTGVVSALEGIKQLKRQLKIAEEEREILKKKDEARHRFFST